jgi:hypothetical protein
VKGFKCWIIFKDQYIKKCRIINPIEFRKCGDELAEAARGETVGFEDIFYQVVERLGMDARNQNCFFFIVILIFTKQDFP